MTRIESESDSAARVSAKSKRTNAWDNVIDIVEDVPLKRSAKEVVDNARSFFRSGRTIPIKFREKQLKGLLKFLEDEKLLIEEALYKVSGALRTSVKAT